MGYHFAKIGFIGFIGFILLVEGVTTKRIPTFTAACDII
jgi:hypothetical protein